MDEIELPLDEVNYTYDAPRSEMRIFKKFLHDRARGNKSILAVGIDYI